MYQTDVSRLTASGNGTAVEFPVAMPLYDVTHLQVWEYVAATGVLTLLTRGTNYTLSLYADYSGGMVQFVHDPGGGSVVYAPPTGTAFIFLRVVPFTQDTNLRNWGKNDQEALERQIDLAFMAVSQLAEVVDRCAKLDVTYGPGSGASFLESITAQVTLAIAARVAAESAAATATTQAGLATTNGAAQVALATTQAGLAEAAEDAAVVAQGLAEDARDLAAEYATKAEDSPITGHPTDYSAYHWSKKAEAAASGGSVKVSANDTTPGYLEAKIVASTGIVLLTNNDGVNETRSIGADVGTTAGKLVQLNASGHLPVLAVPPFHISRFLPRVNNGGAATATIEMSEGIVATGTTQAVGDIIVYPGGGWAVSNGNAINGYLGGNTLPANSTIHLMACKGTSGTGLFAYAQGQTLVYPVGYNSAARRVYSFITDFAGNIKASFHLVLGGGQLLTLYPQAITDVSVASHTTGVLYVLSVPTGINVQPLFRGTVTGNTVLFTSPAFENDVACPAGASAGTVPGYSAITPTSGAPVFGADYHITDTAGRIRARCYATGSNLYVRTRGFIDFRGI